MDFKLIETTMNRRTFLCRLAMAGLAGSGVLMGLAACGGGKKEEPSAKAAATTKPAADPCSDLSALTQDELATRTTFQYTETAADPAKDCTTCNFWQAPTGAGPCGTCTLVKGPIRPQGSCMSWVEIQQS